MEQSMMWGQPRREVLLREADLFFEGEAFGMEDQLGWLLDGFLEARGATEIEELSTEELQILVNQLETRVLDKYCSCDDSDEDFWWEFLFEYFYLEHEIKFWDLEPSEFDEMIDLHENHDWYGWHSIWEPGPYTNDQDTHLSS